MQHVKRVKNTKNNSPNLISCVTRCDIKPEVSRMLDDTGSIYISDKLGLVVKW